ncbi:MAG: phosphoribosylaminoimidazolesuccinocarboxamide synthase, partial [Sediminibacterium sp.]|nr:phosphoribosylaminoimidazolesuccinocarboxamide synthase [Sediminibacterium sp.]
QFLLKGGLILGICNGFQALVRSGLLPFGNFSNTHSILFKNDINKHVSSIIKTKITSNNSPWLYNYKIGDIHTIPVSHGEGKFVTDEKTLQTLITNNQIATQYVNDKHNPTMDMPFNPNGSLYAIEGLISPNGQIFGKMGHSERIKENLYKNIPQMNQQNIFKKINFMEKNQLLYEGKAKKIFATENPSEILVYYKDDATAFNAQKRGTVVNKGVLNNKITEIIFNFLKENNIPTHFIKRVSDREQVCKRVQIIPLEIIVRNYFAGSTAKKLNVEEGVKPDNTIFELCYKNDSLGDPLINEHHAVALNLATYTEIEYILEITKKINELLKKFWDE